MSTHRIDGQTYKQQRQDAACADRQHEHAEMNDMARATEEPAEF
jgi:hypothetical protein